MSSPAVSVPKLLLLLVLALPVTLVLAMRNSREVAPKPTGFRDIAPEAGLDFKMAFLPAEQGENFKICLNRAGCCILARPIAGKSTARTGSRETA